MALNLPQRRTNIKQIQIPQRQVPFDQIIATYGQSPKAEAIRQIGNVIGTVMQQRAALRKQGEELAALSRFTGQDYTGLNPEVAQNLALINARQQQNNITPTSQIDESVEILNRNPNTGELTTLAGDPYRGPIKKGTKILNLTPSSADKRVQELDLKLQTAHGIVDFFEQKMAEVPSGEGLAGRARGLGLKLEAFLQTNPEAAGYQALYNGLRAQVARSLGEVGNLTEQEQKYALDLLPKLTDNTETRKVKVDNFRSYITTKIESSKNLIEGGSKLRTIERPAEFRWNPQTGKLEKI